MDKTLLAAALEGLELQKQRIEEQILDVKRQLGERPAAPSPNKSRSSAPRKARKRVLSATARKRIAAAQKKRWAEYRKKKEAGAA